MELLPPAMLQLLITGYTDSRVPFPFSDVPNVPEYVIFSFFLTLLLFGSILFCKTPLESFRGLLFSFLFSNFFCSLLFVQTACHCLIRDAIPNQENIPSFGDTVALYFALPSFRVLLQNKKLSELSWPQPFNPPQALFLFSPQHSRFTVFFF